MKLLTQDGLEVEATKEQIKKIEAMRAPVWDRFDSWDKCAEFLELAHEGFYLNQNGIVSDISQDTHSETGVPLDKNHSTTENRQKAVLAYLQLSVIAEAWNGEICSHGYFIHPIAKSVYAAFPSGLFAFFKTKELAEKSYELFPELYNDLKNGNL